MNNMENHQGAEAIVEGLVDLMQGRADTYRLLARLYRHELSEEDLDILHDMMFPADSANADIDTGYRLIATYLSNLWCESAEELQIDYARCFVGHGEDTYGAAFPFESVYTSPKRLLMQDARDKVLATYRACGLDKSDDWREGEDHIALELEFMAFMAQRCSEALAEGRDDKAGELLETQLKFLEGHLLVWTPMLTADMRKFAKSELYLGLSYLTDGFLADDAACIKGVVAA